MHLPNTAEYALRVMGCMMLKKDDQYIKAKVLARMSNIPRYYLPKILRKLVNAGLVDSQKGQHGGFKLKQDPSEITFKKILKAVDYNFCVDDCVFGWEDCEEDEKCPMHDQWIEINHSFQKWAESKTLGGIDDKAK